MISLEESYARCTALAKSHYENFPVGLLVPRALQPQVHAVYAFARIADDFADEGYSSADVKPSTSGLPQPKTTDERLNLLEDWEQQLLHPTRPDLHPVFPAVHDSIHRLNLPTTLFTDLLSAFKQDVVKRRYENFPEVLDYCRRSANPIGRLVLLLHGKTDEHLHQLSDHICTALQLANFWQDVAVDLQKNRIYLPLEDLQTHGVTENDLFSHRATSGFHHLMKFQVDRTQDLFNQGKPLSQHLPWPLQWEIRFTWLGGTTILRKIERLNYNTLNGRPKLSRWDFLRLGIHALISQ